MKSTVLVYLFLLVFLSPAVMAGKLNKCIAAGGAVTYTDKPCAESASTQTLETRSATPPPDSDAALNRMGDKVFALQRKACAEARHDFCRKVTVPCLGAILRPPPISRQIGLPGKVDACPIAGCDC